LNLICVERKGLIATLSWSFNIEFLLEVNHLSKHVLFGIGLNFFYSSIAPPKHRRTPQLTFPKHHNNPHIASTLQQMFVQPKPYLSFYNVSFFSCELFSSYDFLYRASFFLKAWSSLSQLSTSRILSQNVNFFFFSPSFTLPTFTCISTLLVPSSFFPYHFSLKLFMNSFQLFQL